MKIATIIPCILVVGVSIPKEIVLEIEFITVGVEYHVPCVLEWGKAVRRAGKQEEDGQKLLKGMTKETNKITIIKTNNTI